MTCSPDTQRFTRELPLPGTEHETNKMIPRGTDGRQWLAVYPRERERDRYTERERERESVLYGNVMFCA